MPKCLRLSTCVYTVIAVVMCLGVFVGLKTYVSTLGIHEKYEGVSRSLCAETIVGSFKKIQVWVYLCAAVGRRPCVKARSCGIL